MLLFWAKYDFVPRSKTNSPLEYRNFALFQCHFVICIKRQLIISAYKIDNFCVVFLQSSFLSSHNWAVWVRFAFAFVIWFIGIESQCQCHCSKIENVYGCILCSCIFDLYARLAQKCWTTLWNDKCLVAGLLPCCISHSRCLVWNHLNCNRIARCIQHTFLLSYRNRACFWPLYRGSNYITIDVRFKDGKFNRIENILQSW